MKTRIEYREKFNIYGYTSPLMNEVSYEREVALLWENYESKLKSILAEGDHLSFVIWFKDEQHWFYHFGVRRWDHFANENATCVEVPSGYYAVGTAVFDVPVADAWNQLMDARLDAAGNVPVMEILEQANRKYLESYIDKDGNYEVWTPIVDVDESNR